MCTMPGVSSTDKKKKKKKRVLEAHRLEENVNDVVLIQSALLITTIVQWQLQFGAYIKLSRQQLVSYI